MLTQRQIEIKRSLVKPYRGISYCEDIDAYEVKFRTGTDVYGEPIYITPIKRFRQFDNAVKRWKECKILHINRIDRDSKITLETLYNNWQDRCEAVKNTKNLVRSALRSMADKTIYNEDVRFITRMKMRSIFEELQKHLKVSTLKTYQDAMRILLYSDYSMDYLEDRGIEIAGNITKFKLVDKKKEAKKIDVNVCYTLDELKKLIDCAGSDRAFIMTLICTGARISEVLGLKPDNIEDEAITIDGQKDRTGTGKILTKTKKSRFVPAPPIVIEKLREHIAVNGIKKDEYIFPMCLTTAQNKLRRIEKRADVASIEGRAVHRFRHTLITYLEEKGVDNRLFVGHSAGGDVHKRIYTHINRTQIGAFMIAIEELWLLLSREN